jgi:hypothetical protein
MTKREQRSEKLNQGNAIKLVFMLGITIGLFYIRHLLNIDFLEFLTELIVVCYIIEPILNTKLSLISN